MKKDSKRVASFTTFESMSEGLLLQIDMASGWKYESPGF